MLRERVVASLRRTTVQVGLAALAGTLVATLVFAVRSPSRSAESRQTSVASALARLPLAFEPNVGQAARGTSFVAREGGYDLLIRPTGLTMLLGSTPTSKTRGSSATPTAMLPPARLSLRTLGSNRTAQVSGVSKLPGTVNYFRGRSASSWITGLATYGRVRVGDVYPGIDLMYSGTRGRIEYDFDVAPHADPRTIRLGVTGAASLSVDSAGNLVATTRAGAVVEHAPLAYQSIGGRRVPVRVSFLLRHRTVGFDVADYDRSARLVIDPVVSYSTFLSGDDSDNQTYGVAVDPSSGDIVVSGFTDSWTFLGTTTPKGALFDAFVTELNATGSQVLYSDYLGGDGDDESTAVALDSSGNAYVTGFTDSNDFPLAHSEPTTNDNNGTFGHDFDAFVTEVSPDGSSLVYSTLLGGSNDDEAEAIAVGSDGAAYVTGLTASVSSFKTTTGAYEKAPTGTPNWQAFVTKLPPSGGFFEAADYSTLLGGSISSDDSAAPDQGYSEGIGIAVDSSGNAYVTGLTLAENFPTTAGAFSSSMGSSATSGFVSELNPSGSSLTYSTLLGSKAAGSQSQGNGIALVGGKIVVAGTTDSGGFPVVDAYQPGYRGAFHGSNAFVSEIDPAASGSAQLVYSTFLGGTKSDIGEGVAVDQSDGAVYVTGGATSTNFPVSNAFTPTFVSTPGPPPEDAFVARVDPSKTGASSLVWSSYLGGGRDEGDGIATDGAGHVFVVGTTSSSSFPTVNPVQGLPGSSVESLGFLTTITDSEEALANTVPPVVSGQAVVGQTLTSTVGTWSGATPIAKKRQWLRCDAAGANCVAIGPAVYSAYVVKAADVGHTLRVVVTASNVAGVTSAESLPTVEISLETSPASVDFGSVVMGQKGSPHTITLTNTGAADITVTASGVVWTTDPYDFVKASAGTCPNGTTLVPGASCSLTVRFEPQVPYSVGLLSATFEFSTSVGKADVSLSGTGTTLPSVSVSPTVVEFDSAVIGETSGPRQLTLTNTGTPDVTIRSSGVLASSPDPSDFIKGSGTCTNGAVLASGASCSIDILFEPQAPGSRSATFEFATSAGHPDVSLLGTGSASSVSASPTSLDFGSLTVGHVGAPQMLTLTNDGATDLTVSSSGVLATSTDPSDFAKASAGTCTNGAVVAAGDSCSLTVRFQPAATGPLSAVFRFATDAGSVDVDLSGTGGALPVSAAPTSIAFGSTVVGHASAAQTITLTNNSAGALTVSSSGVLASSTDPSDFAKASAGTCTNGAVIASGDSCSLTVKFKPTATGPRSATFQFSTSAGKAAVALSGTGS